MLLTAVVARAPNRLAPGAIDKVRVRNAGSNDCTWGFSPMIPNTDLVGTRLPRPLSVGGRRQVLRAIAVLCLVAAATVRARRAGAADGPRRIAVRIEGRKVVGGTRTIKLTQGEAVEIRWTTDEATEVHLHGYNIKAAIRPGEPVTMSFEARAAGRFPVSAHGIGRGTGAGHGEKTLIYIEIHPR